MHSTLQQKIQNIYQSKNKLFPFCDLYSSYIGINTLFLKCYHIFYMRTQNNTPRFRTCDDQKTDKLSKSGRIYWEFSLEPKTITSVLSSFRKRKCWASHDLTSSKHCRREVIAAELSLLIGRYIWVRKCWIKSYKCKINHLNTWTL